LRILWRLGFHLDLSGANHQIINQIKRNGFDLVWIDKGLTISANTLCKIKTIQPSCPSISYNPDDIMNRRTQSRRYITALPFYDFVITTKTFNVMEVKNLGAQNVIYVGCAYDPHTHHPWNLIDSEKQEWGCEVGFTGAFEADRYKRMLVISNTEQEVVVRGPNWERYEKRHSFLTIKPGFIAGDNYAKAISATRINLGFLCKVNRDSHTTRSVEIPACGAFMLAERTGEHLELFEEGKEAEFFETDQELIDKVKYYLKHEGERQRIAQAGRERCLRSGYSNHERIKDILRKIGHINLV
jgi:spore maturation protein CgeB